MHGDTAIPSRHIQIQADSSACSPPHLHRPKGTYLYTGHKAVGLPGCVYRHACSPTFPATWPHGSSGTFTYPCFHAATYTLLQGRGMDWGLPDAPTALSLGLSPLCPCEAVAPCPGTSRGLLFMAHFLSGSGPACFMSAAGVGGVCGHELGQSRPCLGLG